MTTEAVRGRLVLDHEVVAGVIRVEDGLIAGSRRTRGLPSGPLIAPGFVDVHVHGWGGHSAMGETAALDGMARALLRQGVTCFLPTAWTAPIADARRVRRPRPRRGCRRPGRRREPLGFNLEGPFLSEAKKGAHDPATLRGAGRRRRADDRAAARRPRG